VLLLTLAAVARIGVYRKELLLVLAGWSGSKSQHNRRSEFYFVGGINWYFYNLVDSVWVNGLLVVSPEHIDLQKLSI